MDGDKSEFNYALSYLNRINAEFYICANAKMSLDIKAWLDSLVVIYTELTNFIKKYQPDEQIKRRNELKELYGKVNRYVTDSNKRPTQKVAPDLFWELIDFELWLRDIFGEAGLETKLVEDATKALR